MPELVGSCCVHCGEPITGDLDGRFCSQCGQPVHTRCVRQPSPFAEYGCRECGIDSGENGQAAAGETGTFPIGNACPKCGSADHKVVKPVAYIAFRWDRVCRACGTRYTPPTPMWAGIAFILMGLFLAAAGGVSVFFGLGPADPLRLPAMMVSGFVCALGLCAVAHGFRTLMKSGQG